MLPAQVIAYFKPRFNITTVHSVGGGCINDCYKLLTSKGRFFLKLNSATAFPGMFEAEARGLQLLSSTGVVRIPEVYEQGQAGELSLLLMEFIETGIAGSHTISNFGRQLARLHQNTETHFGADHNNYIGSLPQKNTPAYSWSDFFIENRLKPQLQMAASARLLSADVLRQFDALFVKLPSLFTPERPSLLHGDLWSGNYLIDQQGQACLVDPAAYYGHREMDIAMSQLFGGFSLQFYESYNHHYPLEPGWQERIRLWNLYPLLVHVNLFGGSYVAQVKTCLAKFV